MWSAGRDWHPQGEVVSEVVGMTARCGCSGAVVVLLVWGEVVVGGMDFRVFELGRQRVWASSDSGFASSFQNASDRFFVEADALESDSETRNALISRQQVNLTAADFVFLG
jgi:hypothetical protein